MFSRNPTVPGPEDCLPGRDTPLIVPDVHYVLGSQMAGPYPDSWRRIQFAMGCFWGVERIFWQLDGVKTTAAGYAGGGTPNPTYKEVCSGGTGHTEVVQVMYDPAQITLTELLKTFWENHDPTQGMRQGNDRGTQYRSAIYADVEDMPAIEACRNAYAEALSARGLGPITTEIETWRTFYFAEDYHQQYLAKNPNGYCGIGGTGVSCPIGLIGTDDGGT